MRGSARVIMLLMMVMAAPSASAEVLGSLTWDARELVHLAAAGGENLLDDPRFERMGESWSVSFVDVGGGNASVRDGRLTLATTSTASGAAYAEARVPVIGGATYHFAFEARLVGNASEVAALVIPLGGGPELVLRGEPRLNEWGFGGEWQAPEGEREARVLLRFLVEEGETGAAEFSRPWFAEGPPPEWRIDGEPGQRTIALAPGNHTVEVAGATTTLVVVDQPPTIRIDGPRFVPRHEAPAFATTFEDDAPQLIPNTQFDRYRGWWSLSQEPHVNASLHLDRQEAHVAIPATERPANLSIAGVLRSVPGDRWRLEVDAEIPPGVLGHIFLRERDFAAGAADVEWHDAAMRLDGPGPWILEADRGYSDSETLLVILAFEVSPGPSRTVRLHEASLTPALERRTLDPLRAPPQAYEGLARVAAFAEDHQGQVAQEMWEYWVGESPSKCVGEGVIAAWVGPEEGEFVWKAGSGPLRPVSEATRVQDPLEVTLLHGDEVWWRAAAADPADPLPRIDIARGGSATLSIPCAVGELSTPHGIRAESRGAAYHIRALPWRTPAAFTLMDENGAPVAEVHVREPTSTWVVGGSSILGMMVFLGARRWRS